MTLKGFLFLLGITIATVIVAGLIAEAYAQPGLQRTLFVAGITALVVFPAGKLAERLGWVKGNVQLGQAGRAIAGKKTADLSATNSSEGQR